MQISRKKIIEILKILGIILAIYIILRITVIPILVSEQFLEFTTSIGRWGYLIVVGYIVLSHVFAPLIGSPGVILGVTVYGIEVGLILLYIAGLISASINFYISRKLGRQWVRKLVGKKALMKVDEFTSVEGTKALVVSRLFGPSLFDFISYAAGLTNISFKKYFLITSVTGIFTHLVTYILFRNVDLQSEIGIMIWVGFVLGGGLFFGLIVRSYLKKVKN